LNGVADYIWQMRSLKEWWAYPDVEPDPASALVPPTGALSP
jgi:hypothetical protein